MIVLDTNVLSEPLKPKPDSNVTRWLDAQPLETLYVSTITIAEMYAGNEAMPDGKRKRVLQERLTSLFADRFKGRILPFDARAPVRYGQIVGQSKRRGVVISMADAAIAATALIYGYAVATRDESPFVAAGVRVLNPWTA